MTDFAIYDMDRTVTRRATYTPFLMHCALRRAPWRLLLLPFVIASMIAYAVKLIDRARLNVNGSSVAIGHPFAATGTRIVAQLARQLSESATAKRGLISVCTAGGMGVVAILEKA